MSYGKEKSGEDLVEWKAKEAVIEMGGFGIRRLSTLVFQTSTLGKMEKQWMWTLSPRKMHYVGLSHLIMEVIWKVDVNSQRKYVYGWLEMGIMSVFVRTFLSLK